MNKIKTFTFLIALMISQFNYAQIKLPKLISDNMILQRDINNKLWGWASPNEKIELQFNDTHYNTTADNKGKWSINLPAQIAGGPHELIFTASNVITVKNILFGDVWICSGQSNMEITMARVSDRYAQIIANANNLNIRQFEVADTYDFKNEKDDIASGQWSSVDQKSILNFSAVAYFFANEIYTKYKIPIGLINSAVGGSPAESWMSEDAIKKFPEYYSEAQKFKSQQLIDQIELNDKNTSQQWYNLANNTDEGIKNKWANKEVNTADWKTMKVPGYWSYSELGNVNGVVWFRKEFNLPVQPIGNSKLILGRIVDADSVFINGSFVGSTSYQYPPRRYPFSTNILKTGQNEIVVRVVNNSGNGGFVLDKPYQLIVNNDTLNLQGNWKYKLGAKMKPLPGQTFVRWKPVGLFNAMIAPLTHLPIKGVIWYQGESNTKKPSEYSNLMSALINDWRAKWQQGNFPFLYVQLPNYMEPTTIPTESSWAALRQEQTNILKVANTGMAVTIDLGEWNDIHPLNKFEIGRRLALQAKNLVYGDKKIVAGGPLFKDVQLKNDQLTVSFTNIGSGLTAKNSKDITGFSIAGADNIFINAKARIENNKIIVWNSAVSHPKRIRYAWANNPANANLYNLEQLPAATFEATIKQ